MTTSTQKSVEEKLQALSALDPGSDPKRMHEALRAALGDRHYRIVAKAADLAAERLFYDLQPSLRDAYQRFLQDPVKRDPNCIAKRAIARALVTLECNHVAFFLEGLRYWQMEPVWGGSVDTAIDVRTSCAMGLVATGYPRALHEVAALLNDGESRARQGAVRAIACGNPREAELLLRFKASIGDAEPEVVGDCLSGLLSVAPEECVDFVAEYLGNSEPAIGEVAALALGESRLYAALPHLQRAWEQQFGMTDLRRALLRAAALHRSEAAFNWLLSIAAEAHSSVAEAVIEVLAIYRHNDRLRGQLGEVLAARRNRSLNECFERSWG